VLPFLLIVEMLDIPLVLATRSDEAMRANLLNDPSAGTGLASYWVAFMHTGGERPCPSWLSVWPLGASTWAGSGNRKHR